MKSTASPLYLARRVLLCLASALALSSAQSAPGLPSTNVAWLPAAGDADIDRAFAQARAEKKPVLLYWGATWCPPCNQLKATLFNRQDFATQARSFVAVHVDGDRPGAQKLGSRFKVRGYPTVILMTADGAEISRLPGDADAPQIMAVLQAGLSGGRPIRSVLADARAGKTLTPNEWRMLAFHGWEVDEDQLVPAKDRPALLADLARRSEAASGARDSETSTRLWLKALAASDDGKGLKPEAAQRDLVQRVLGEAGLTRTHMDVLANEAPDIVQVLTAEESPERAALVARYETALVRLQADAALARADRLSALVARVRLGRLGQGRDVVQPRLPEALVREVRDTAARLDREITDGYERQALITTAGWLLGQAGLWADSDALLKANLTKSHSPYYLMSQLAGNARKLGRTDEALQWYQQSFDRSEGPATRLQWGAGYFSALVELAPADAVRIEKTAAQLFSEAAKDKGAFHERSARSLQRVGSKLNEWNKDGSKAAVLQRLKRQLDGVCAGVDAADGQRATCEGVLKLKTSG
jgi:thiol-disulfide isomerase/thioredoxin